MDWQMLMPHEPGRNKTEQVQAMRMVCNNISNTKLGGSTSKPTSPDSMSGRST